MKNVTKRMIALILMGIMSVSLIGCGSKKQNSDSKSNTEAISKETTGKSSNTSEETTKPDVPKERQKITVAVYDRGNIPASEGTIIDNRWTKWINENAPVEVEFVAIPRWESGQKYNTLFASGTAPDLIEEFGVANMNTFYTNGLLMPLNDIIEEYSNEYKAVLAKYPSLPEFLTKEDGQMYTFGVISHATTNHYLIMRSDWLKNLGLEVPTTDAEFAEICRAFTYDDPDQNGQDDTLALSYAGTVGNLIRAMYGGMGNWLADWYKADPYSDETEIAYHWDHAESYVSYMKNFYDEGYVSKDFAVDTSGTQATQDFTNGKIGILGVNGGKGQVLTLLTNLTANNPDADFTAIALPTTEYGAYAPAGGVYMQSNAAINADCKNPEAVMAYIDWLNTPETLMMLKYGGDEYSQVDSVTGAYVPKDQEQFTTEVSYNVDMHMTSSKINDPYFDVLAFDLNDSIQKRSRDIIVTADKLYLDPDRIFYQLMTNPPLTEELTLVTANVGTQIDDIYTKCILGGSSYTVEQAMTDAKKIFTDAGADGITTYYNEWHSKNNGFASTEDMVKMLPEYVK